jgi:hypothetical protein
MTRLTKLGLIAILSILFVGCGSISPTSNDAKTENYTFINSTLTQKKVHDGILQAGEEAGWRMTEFKENMILAEKVGDDNTKAVTIVFNNKSFSLSPNDDDLEDAILEKFNH